MGNREGTHPAWGEILDTFHKIRRGNWCFGQVRRPIRWAGRQDDITSFPANEDFPRVELKSLGQAYRLAPVVHEDFSFALHLFTDSIYSHSNPAPFGPSDANCTAETVIISSNCAAFVLVSPH